MKRSYLILLALSTLSMVLVTGCYVMKQGIFLLHYASEAEHIELILKKKDLTDENRYFLQKVIDIKTFATTTLGLKENNNYTRYVYTDKEYLVDVVTACKDDKFEPYLWTFPIVGKVPYKGFYQRKDALRQGKQLKANNYDVLIRKVDAFSTLGFFKDPVYSFMKKYSDYSLANLIIHEQTHATVFIKDNIQFNEELATFVGNEGALLFIASQNGNSREIRQELDNIHKDQNTFFSLIRYLHDKLNYLYNQDISRSVKLEMKEKIIDDFKSEVRDNYNTYFLTDIYTSVPDRKINNAYILSWMRYTEDLSLFSKLYEKYDKNFPEFINAIKEVEHWKGDPKEYVKSLL